MSKPNKQESRWLNDRVLCKVFNMERPGDDVHCGVNGFHFQMQHGATVKIPRAVIGALKNAIKIKHSSKVVGEEEIREEIEVPRFEVVIINGGDENDSSTKAQKMEMEVFKEVQEDIRGKQVMQKKKGKELKASVVDAAIEKAENERKDNGD